MNRETSAGSGSLYRTPGEAPRPAVVLWQSIAQVLVAALLVLGLITQWVAHGLGAQPALGQPLLVLGRFAFYSPLDGVLWWLHWGLNGPAAARAVLAPVPWALLLILLGGLVHVGLRLSRAQRAAKLDAEHLHGSAHWATPDEVKATGLMGTGRGVYVGAWKHPRTGTLHYLRHDGPEHIMAFAPTRSGKGVGLVLPTLLSWPHSALVYDIKGENWALTAGWRQSGAGNRVLKFEPTSADGSSVRYNPLAQVRVGTDKEVADVQNLMTMIVDPDGKGLQDHWAKTAQALLVGVGLHVLYSEPDRSLKGIVDLLTNPTRPVKKTLEHMLATVHDLPGQRGWKDPAGKRTLTHPVVAAVARDMLNKAEEEMSGVLSTAVSFLTLYRDPLVARNTAASDFRVGDLMNSAQPVSLYLVVPPSDKDRLRPLIRLMINQIVRALTEQMSFKDGRSVASYKHRMLLMLDEFPSLGKLDIFEESLAFIAGYGLKAYLIIQDISQLWTAYGKDESIFSNCHVRIAYAPNKIETAELLSRMAGTATVVRQTYSYSGSKYGSLSNASAQTQETQRPLLTADEVMRLPAARKDASGNVTESGDMLIFMAGHSPIYGRQILYFLDPVFSERARVPAPARSDTLGPAPTPKPVAAASAPARPPSADAAGKPEPVSGSSPHRETPT